MWKRHPRPRVSIEPTRTLYRPSCNVALFLLAIGLIISLRALCVAQETAAKPISATNKTKLHDPEAMRKAIRRLTTEIESLRKKVAELEKIREFNSVHDRLKTEEKRVVELEDKMMEIAEKEEGLQRRLNDVNEQLRPENIDRLPIGGALRPEQMRDAARRRFNEEKQHIESQLTLLQQNRTRLQASLAVTDLVIPPLRAQLQNSINHALPPGAAIRPQ
jgi:TolA-binding protein